MLKRKLTSPTTILIVGMFIAMGVQTGMLADSPEEARFNESLRQNITITQSELAERESPEERFVDEHAPERVRNILDTDLRTVLPDALTLSEHHRDQWQMMWVDGINGLLTTALDVAKLAAIWTYQNKGWLPGQWFVMWVQGVTFATSATAGYYRFRHLIPELRRD